MAISQSDLDNWFHSHAPEGDHTQQYGRIGSEYKRAAKALLKLTPPGAEQDAMIMFLRQSMYNAYAAIACGATATANSRSKETVTV